MRIGIISDTHFGYEWDSERRDDCFGQAAEAIDRCLEAKVDLILLPGDIFDNRVPKQDVWVRALRVLAAPLRASRSEAKLASKIAGLKEPMFSDLALSGVPVVAIHGTHERRAGTNPVQMLEAAGFIVYLHCSGVVFERDGQQVAIQGLSGVPESYVPEALRQWDPKPIPGAYNILVMHQGIKGYIYDDAAFLSVKDLPKGFDAIVNGHVHASDCIHDDGMLLLHPGSTITTQMTKGETKPKGFYLLDTVSRSTEFFSIACQRQLFYEEFAFKDAEPKDVVSAVRDKLASLPLSTANQKKPLVKLKLTGSLKVGSSFDRKAVLEGFDSQAIIGLDDQLESADFKLKIEALRQMQSRRLSVVDMGMRLLSESLAEAGYKGVAPELIFDDLAEGDADAVLKRVCGGWV